MRGSVTRSRPSEARPVHSRVGLAQYVQARRPTRLFGGLIAVAAAESFFGSQTVQLPAATAHGAITIPFLYELPIITASLIVGSMHSGMSTLEEAAATPFRRAQVNHVIFLLVLTEALTFAAARTTVLIGDDFAAVRGLAGWAGLALLAGRLLGWRLSWTLPAVTVFPLIYFGYDDDGRPRWWNWPTATPHNAVAWTVTIALLLIGVAALSLTPWRLAATRRRASLPRLAHRGASGGDLISGHRRGTHR